MVEPGGVSERESEVLAAVGDHLSNAQIASRLHISVRTVESHVSSLLRKFGVADRRALAALAPSLVSEPGSAITPGRLVGAPSSWTPFIGRAAERAALTAALGESRLVTLVGPGGVGKTRLATVVADDVAATLPLGGAFVELVGARSGFLVQAVAGVLGVAELPQQPLQKAVQEHLCRGRSLLVLDNCEHLLDDAAGLVEQLLAGCPELVLLATSRERLGIPGERVVPLPGLSLAADDSDRMSGSDAEALFLARARAFDPDLTVDKESIKEVCARLDGIPLAIELAAARTASLGVTGLLAGVDDKLRLLAGGRSSDQRHRSLRAVIDWSHELLDEDERRLFRRLGIFAGGFDLDAARRVTEVRSRAVVTDLIGRLVDKSLLVHRRGTAESRWRLLETVRAYAVDRLAAADEEADVVRRHLAWAAQVATDLSGRLAEDADEWQADFELVADDLRAALTAAASGPDADAHRLARGLGRLVYARRFLAEARQHFASAAEHALDQAAAAADLLEGCYVAQVEMYGEVGFDLGLASARAAAAGGDRRTQAIVLSQLVVMAGRFPALFGADPPLDRLTELLAEAEACAPAGDPLVAAHLAAARAWHGQRIEAMPTVARFDYALTAARRSDDVPLVSGAMDLMSSLHQFEGRTRAGFRLALDRLELAESLPRHDPRCEQELGDALHMAIEGALNVADLPAALELCERFLGPRRVRPLPALAASKPLIALVLQGRFDEAVSRVEPLRQLWEETGRPSARWMAPPTYAIALAHGLRGADAEAAEWARFGRQLAGTPTTVVHINLAGFAMFVDARIAVHAGRLDDALAVVADRLADPRPWDEVRHLHLDAYAWAIAAEVAVLAGRPDAAEQLAKAAPAGEQNAWAAACLARARGRLTGDRQALEESIAAWDEIGAQFERACTVALLPDPD